MPCVSKVIRGNIHWAPCYLPDADGWLGHPEKESEKPAMTNEQELAETTCPICGKPLGDIETALHRPYHYDCMKCAFCAESLPSAEVIDDCLRKGYPISHHGCRERHLIREIKDKTIPVTQAHIDVLNRDILRFMDVPPALDDIEQLTSLIKSVTELAANVSFVFSHVSQRVRIVELRKGQAEIRASEGQRLIAKRADEADRIRRQTERANPAIRDRRKAIEGLVQLGISPDEATKMIDHPHRSGNQKEIV